LAHAYEEALRPHDVSIAQVLLTIGDTEERRRYLNARGTLNALLGLGAVPLINENDTVATSEIRYGDNDRLAARVALMASADCLVLLSDVDGLYDGDPSANTDAILIPEVERITPEIEAMAGATQTATGTGGMITKIEAAKMALSGGCHVAITSGKSLKPLSALESGARCTWFIPRENPRVARKQWIGASLRPTGRLTVDNGATAALANGRSLLPAGVISVDGEFERGDAVIILDTDGHELGRGLCAYSTADARLIMGHKSGEIEDILGYRGRDEMIHRDDLALS
jgi:glutamate 5-kinase